MTLVVGPLIWIDLSASQKRNIHSLVTTTGRFATTLATNLKRSVSVAIMTDACCYIFTCCYLLLLLSVVVVILLLLLFVHCRLFLWSEWVATMDGWPFGCAAGVYYLFVLFLLFFAGWWYRYMIWGWRVEWMPCLFVCLLALLCLWYVR